MAKITTSPKLPWREQDIRSGDPKLLADYLKALIRNLQKVFGEICDTINVNDTVYAKKDLSNVEDNTVLDKIKNVDGSDSGLDADKLDGFDASQTKTANTIPVSNSDGWLNDWINQGEGSGLDADKVRGLPADFSYSAQQNGYTKLPNGIIIQWGRATGSSSGETVTFPIAFPNNCFAVVAVGYGGDVSDSSNTAVNDVTTSSFKLLNQGGWGCCWMAIGN